MPTKTLQGKRCLITGAASGIGRATAVATAARGGELMLTDRDDAALQDVADRLRSTGARVPYARALDIADHDAVAAMAQEIHGSHGSLDVLMNIAGISIWGTVEHLEHDQWRRVVDINLMGPIHVIECFIPPMIQAGRGGHLVNVSSAAGLFGLPWHAAYSASKFGLRGVSEVLRFDLHRHGIGVSLVCPGGVRTPLVQTVEIAGVDREAPALAKMTAHFAKRAITPERAAEAILTGIEKDRYMVYTSRDIQLGHLAQRLCPPAYAFAMRRLNDAMTAVAARAVPPEVTPGER